MASLLRQSYAAPSNNYESSDMGSYLDACRDDSPGSPLPDSLRLPDESQLSYSSLWPGTFVPQVVHEPDTVHEFHRHSVASGYFDPADSQLTSSSISTASIQSDTSSNAASPRPEPIHSFAPDLGFSLGQADLLPSDYPAIDDLYFSGAATYVDPVNVFCPAKTIQPPFPGDFSGYAQALAATDPAASPPVSPPLMDATLPWGSFHVLPEADGTPAVMPVALPLSPPEQPSPSHSAFVDDGRAKDVCPMCSKAFKDMKAHIMTHNSERPEKCPIPSCSYHVKGFSRKYDKNRHTLTHYKGTMVCGFCPGSGSAAEKSFNRADVFKRHLTSVHAVEQTQPNCRRRTDRAGGASGRKPTAYASDATGKCSTCHATFADAQDFYEHLDDCVLRIVQQEDPGEAINASRLAEVDHDSEVHRTLHKNNLPINATPDGAANCDEGVDDGDDNDCASQDDNDDDEADYVTDEADSADLPDGVSSDDYARLSSRGRANASPRNSGGGVHKRKGLTRSRHGVRIPPVKARRRNRDSYPTSWGYSRDKMNMRKRVAVTYDGERRLNKDELMMPLDNEVRVPLSGGHFTTDLDIMVVDRANAFLDASEEEKGPYVSDDPTDEERRLMEVMAESGRAS